MKNLLLFYPSNKRTIAMETLVYALKKEGINIMVLTTSEKGDFHHELERHGIETYSLNTNSVWKGVKGLIRFCKRHSITTIHSHLQAANLIAVLAQYFISAKTIIFRHHFELPMKGIERNKNEILGEKLINRLAKTIIVPSSGVYNGMETYEKVNMQKVDIVPYVYDFSKYRKPDDAVVKSIRKQYDCQLLLLICARHVVAKRHILVFKAMTELVKNKNLDIKLLVMDDGPEKENLIRFVKENGLEDYIDFLGFRKDFINYFKAVDLLLHPSVIDASNSVVKEMALLEKTAIVCEGVGDFSDYFTHKENGFLLDPNLKEDSWAEIIERAYNNKEMLLPMSTKLKEAVIQKFGINDKNIEPYMKLIW